MPKPKKGGFNRCKHWLLDQPIVVIIILMVSLFGGLALLTYGLSKPGEAIPDEKDPDLISFRIHVRNTTNRSQLVSSSADFTINEEVIQMIRECAQGHIGLAPLLSTATAATFTIPPGQSRDYSAFLHRIPKYEQLLEQGSCKMDITIRMPSSQTIAVGSIPFKRDALGKHYLDVDLSKTQ